MNPNWEQRRQSPTYWASLHQVPVVQPEGLAPVKALLEKLEQENGGRLPGQLSRWGFPILPFIKSTFTFSQHLLYPELASLALSAPLLDTVSSLLGPNLVLSRASSNSNIVPIWYLKITESNTTHQSS